MKNRQKDKQEIIKTIPETYQRYLETIYNISRKKKGGWVSNKEIAQKLNVEPSSVTSILHKLKALGYIRWRPRKSIRLAEKGKKIAFYLNETQLLLELFFEKVLKMRNKEIITKIACEIEHHIINEAKKSLEHFLVELGYY